MSISNPVLFPQVTQIPGQSVDPNSGNRGKIGKAGPGEFDQLFEKVLQKGEGLQKEHNLNQIREPIKFSAHASQRLQDRKIPLDEKLMSKLNVAVERAEAKGLEDALVLMDNAAFIVSVKNKTVVTALDKASAAGNVFTNIDGAVVV